VLLHDCHGYGEGSLRDAFQDPADVDCHGGHVLLLEFFDD
jgi:hypothetical protein